MFSKCVCVAALTAALVSSVPGTAWAELRLSEVVLGFGVGYEAPDGTRKIHRGVDVAFEAGDRVPAPVSGIVAFAGRVPSAAGGSVLAVSIDTDAGRVTLTPFERLTVRSGQQVVAGSALGDAAASGDPSSAGPHVHLSLRQGDLYLDPTGLLAMPAPVSVPAPPALTSPVVSPALPAPAPVPVPDRLPTAEPVPVREPVAGGAQGVAPSTAPAQAPIPQADPAAQVPATLGSPVGAPAVSASPQVLPSSIAGRSLASAWYRRIMSGAGGDRQSATAGAAAPEMGAGVSLVKSSPGGGVAARRGVRTLAARDAATPLTSFREASGEVARGASRKVEAAGLWPYLAVVAALACAALILSVRAFERRICVDSPVSDRLGRLLQQLRTGDTLHGLTSCPGESAFTVPGPFSPREVTK